jgi:hypothetical protein
MASPAPMAVRPLPMTVRSSSIADSFMNSENQLRKHQITRSQIFSLSLTCTAPNAVQVRLNTF